MIDSGNDPGQHQPPLNIPPPGIPPLDIATIYSWVTMQRSKYRDFSASRQETRTRFNQRLLLKQRAEVARKAREQAEFTQAPVAAPTAAASETASRGEEAADDAVQVSEPTQDSQPVLEPAQVWTWKETPESALEPPDKAISVSAQEFVVEPARDEGETLPSVSATLSDQEEIPLPKAAKALEDPASSENEVSTSQNEALSQNEAEKLESAQAASETHEPAASVYKEAIPGDAATEAEPLRHAKAGLGPRWFALRSVFAGDSETRLGVRAPKRSIPTLAIFSQAGGVGKTSLAATLGRVLAARGEQAFLAETASPGLLPLFFGSRDVKPGVVRTFSPPAGSDDAAVRAVTLDPQQFLEKKDGPALLTEALLRYARGSNRILIDIQTGSKAVAQRLLPLVSLVLIPLLADMNSVMSLNAVEAVFAKQGGANQGESNRGEPVGHTIEPFYLLNQFDGALPLHVEVRGLLQEQLGGRLLPFVVRRSAAVSEALAEGMTVVDYAPNSFVAEDYFRLAAWLASAAPVAASGFSGLRWSER